MRYIITLLLSLSLIIDTTYAFDASTDKGKSKKFSTDTGLSQKESMDKGNTTEVSLSLETLFIPHLLRLEKTDKKFQQCGVISKPKLLKHFGLSAEISPGVFDSIYASALKTAGESNSPVAEFTDENKIRTYRNCLASYGAVIGQAFLNLQHELKDIPNLDKSDLETLSNISFRKVVEGFNSNIKNLYQAVISDTQPCNFNGSSSNIQCGNSMIVISAKPVLSIADVIVYGQNKYFGYSGSFKISASSKVTKELVKTKKEAFEKSESAKWSVSLSKFLPGFN